jgi:hypothetical protein
MYEKGYRSQIIRQIGEHLIVAKLGRLGILATPFAGTVPHFDLLASDLSGRSIPIQVKTIRGPSWQFNAKSFLTIRFKGKRQIIEGKAKLPNRELICVFIHLQKKEPDHFYILTMADLQNHFFRNYKDVSRPKNPESTHCAVWPKELASFRENWDLIIRRFDKKYIVQLEI